MCEFQGDDLLRTLDRLKIETGNLHPNVIRAWFDTDCSDTRNLLNWFCGSLNEENYIAPQEIKEYGKLEVVLHGAQLEKKVRALDAKYPAILDYEENLFEVDELQDEIELLEQQLLQCDSQIEINSNLNESLLAELSKVRSKEIETSLKKESSQRECEKLSLELDEVNEKLYNQIIKYIAYLNNFEFDEDPSFINNLDVGNFGELFKNASQYLNSMMKIENLSLESSLSKPSSNTLTELQTRIFGSKMDCLLHQMEIEKLNYVLNFLQRKNINAISSYADCDQKVILESINFKKEQQSMMLDLVRSSTLKLAEDYVKEPKLRSSQNELHQSQSRLSYLNEVKGVLIKICAHYLTVNSLQVLEKTDIANTMSFFKNTINYVNKDLQNCSLRNEAMLKLYDEYEVFNSKPIVDNYKLLGNFRQLIPNGMDLSLSKMMGEVAEIRDCVARLEKKIYISDIRKSFKDLQSLVNNTKVLEDFLICGPSCRVMVIPQKLHETLNEAKENLANQESAIKLALQIYKTVKTASRNRQRQQLWIHFITNPARMLSLLEQMEINTKPLSKP